MTTFEGKTVLITGASSGIGKACAHAFAAQGARLILAARRLEKIQAVAAELSSTETHLLTLDVRDAAAVQTAIDALPQEWSSIDILINNAGLSRGLDPVQEGAIDDWNQMIDTNVKGLLYVTRAVVPGMVTRNSGHIINLGSTAGEMTYPGGAVYCATKAAERAINDGLRIDLLKTPLRVTTVDPGMVETEFSSVRFHGDEDRAAKVYQSIMPLQPEDVANTIVWVASQPAHVNIARVSMTSIDQANSLLLNRKS